MHFIPEHVIEFSPIQAVAPMANQLKKGFISASSVLFVRLSGAVLNVLLMIVIARFYEAAVVALFFLFTVLVQALSTLGRGGMDYVALKRIAYTDKLTGRDTITSAVLISFAYTLFILLILLILSPILFEYLPLFEGKISLVLTLGLSVIAVSQSAILSETLKGYGKQVQAQLLQTASLPAFAMIFIFCGGSVSDRLFVFYLIAALLTMMLAYKFFLDNKLIGYSATNSVTQSCGLAMEGLPVMWASFLNMGIVWLATVFLNYFAAASDVASYGISIRITMVLGFIMIAVNSIFSPKFALAHRQDDWKKLRSLLLQSAAVALLLALFPLGAIFLFGRELLSIFGHQYGNDYAGLIVLSLGQLVNLATGGVGIFLVMTDHGKVYRNIMLIIFVVAVCAYPYLIKMHGWFGAACITTILWALQNIMTFWYAHKQIHRNIIRIG